MRLHILQAHAKLMFRLILLSVVLASPWPARSQEVPEQPPVEAASDESDDPALEEPDSQSEPESISFGSEANRIVRIAWVLEQDRAKLAELHDELADRQDLFDLMGRFLTEAALELDDLEEQLATLPADSSERAALEAEISDRKSDGLLISEQAELSFTAEKTIRQQVVALEKKIEREERSLKALRQGGDYGTAAEAPSDPVEVAADEGAPSARIPSIIPLPKQADPATNKTNVELRPSAAQIAAAREATRLGDDAVLAEQALVEYVKRHESLETQIGLEAILLETARAALANLEKIQPRLLEIQKQEEAGTNASERRERQANVELVERLLKNAGLEIQRRTLHIGSLEERLVNLDEEGESVSAHADETRILAEKAARHSHWMDSPLHPTNVYQWGRNRLPRMFLVFGFVLLLLLLLRITVRRVARTVVRHSRGNRSTRTNRADTLAFSFQGASTVIIVIGGALLVLQEAGINIQTVLGGAAILGVAIAFGAQNLMRDYFTGFMILLEDQFELGDLVSIGTITGRVERVNMRITMLRDLEGRVHFIPNGEIKSVTNRTYEWGRALVEIPVGFDEDVDRAMEVMTTAADSMRADGDEFQEFVTDVPTMLGVDKFTDFGVVLKMTLQTRPDKIFPVRRELLRRIKNAFDEAGIKVSVPLRRYLPPIDNS